MAPDGGDSGFLHIENNVFSRIDQQGVYLGFKPGLVLNHNTFSAGVMLHDDPTKGGSPTVGRRSSRTTSCSTASPSRT